MKTVLLAASVAPMADSRIYDAAYRAASVQRRERVDRYRFEKDRWLALGAELVLKKALHAVGVKDMDLSFRFGEAGKPYLEDCENLFFNLSHSAEYVLCAVSNCEVGCDMERIKTADLKIAKRFFCQSEYQNILAQSTQDRQNDLFFRYWTLKESFIKATGLGLHLPLDRFEIVIANENVSVLQRVDSRSYSFAEFRTVPDYRCAVCVVDGKCENTALDVVPLTELL